MANHEANLLNLTTHTDFIPRLISQINHRIINENLKNLLSQKIEIEGKKYSALVCAMYHLSENKCMFILKKAIELNIQFKDEIDLILFSIIKKHDNPTVLHELLLNYFGQSNPYPIPENILILLCNENKIQWANDLFLKFGDMNAQHPYFSQHKFLEIYPKLVTLISETKNILEKQLKTHKEIKTRTIKPIKSYKSNLPFLKVESAMLNITFRLRMEFFSGRNKRVQFKAIMKILEKRNQQNRFENVDVILKQKVNFEYKSRFFGTKIEVKNKSLMDIAGIRRFFNTPKTQSEKTLSALIQKQPAHTTKPSNMSPLASIN